MPYNLQDPTIFGNDAGEDEPLSVLSEYFVDQPSFDQFYNNDVRLYFVRSKKGMGKSALLRHGLAKCQLHPDKPIAIYIKASDLVAIQEADSTTPSDLINIWQQRICSRISIEIGRLLKFGFRDDSINVIEKSEINGFKGRNLVGSLFDRLTVKAAGIELGKHPVPSGDQLALLKRIQERRDTKVWIFIDDIDATFINNDTERLNISTFFSACRNITNSVEDINIRASVRTDVWHVIAQYDEALDKCEQYMLDISWNPKQSGQILTNKIATHFKLRYKLLPADLPLKPVHKNIFKDPVQWNGRMTSPFIPVHILSAGRPRWAAQLCRLAANHAHINQHDKISINNIINIMRTYGKSRLSDLYKEHRHQCQQLMTIIESFTNGPSIYQTGELLHHIFQNILPPGASIMLDGKNETDKHMPVAHFLFRIGFINARNPGAGSGFISFEDRPHLLLNNNNPDDGLDWEIHPCYRTILKIYNSTTKTKPPK